MTPVKPGAHAHEKLPMNCVQLPPFSHGSEAHSSMSAVRVMMLRPCDVKDDIIGTV